MKTAIGLLLFAIVALGDQDDPAADQRLKRMSLQQLGNIEVTTASKEPVKVSRTPAAIYVITQEDIRRSGATNLPEVLRLAPGVEVARIDAVKWSIGIRGFGSRLSRSVLVVIDGRTVYSPISEGVFWEVQDTLMEDVDRIEIIRGPGGTIWGPNAVNGVINIITKKAKDTRGALVSMGGGNEQSFLNMRYGGGNGKNFNYRIYGKAFSRGPEFHSDGREFDDWLMGQGGFRMDWDLQSRDSLTFQGDMYKGAIGESTFVSYQPLAFQVDVMQDGQVSGGNLLGRWRRQLGAGSDFQVQTYYDRTTRYEANVADLRNTFDVDFLHHVTRARHEFLWGAGARVSASYTPIVVPTLAFLPVRRTDKLFSAFVQDRIEIAENRLWLTVGSKFAHNDFSGFDAQPSARLMLTPGPRQSWWAAVTRAVRTPSDVEETGNEDLVQLASPLALVRLRPNPQFRPETLLGYEAGFRGTLTSKFYVDVASFHNRYGDLLSQEVGKYFIETSPQPVHYVFPVSYGNGLYGATSGVEIAPDWRPAAWWQLDGSYSYLYMDLAAKANSLDTTSVKFDEGSSPAHKVVARSWFKLPGRFEFSQTFRYVSTLPALRVGSYSTVDARVSWRAKEHFELSVTGDNLLQPHHAEYSGDPNGLVGIKRNVYAQITWRK